MCPTCGKQNQHRAYQGSDGDRPEVSGDGIEVEHECYAGRHEEETEVAQQEVGNIFHPLEFHPPHLEKSGEQQHAYNTTGEAQAGNGDEQFSESHAAE